MLILFSLLDINNAVVPPKSLSRKCHSAHNLRLENTPQLISLSLNNVCF